MRETHTLSIGREALISLSSNVVKMGFGFVGFVLFARVLEPAAFGSYLFVVAGGEMLSNVSAGTGTAIKKRASEVGSNPKELLGIGLFVQAALVVLLASVLFPIEQWLARFVDAPRLAVSVLAIVTTFGLYRVAVPFFEGAGYPGYASWIDTGRSVLTLGTQVVLLLYTDLGSFALVLGLVSGTGVAALSALIICRTVPSLPSRETISDLWEFARWSIPDALVSDVYGKTDTLVIAVIIGSAAVSYYQVPLRLVQPAAFVAGSIAGPLMVRTSGRHSRGMEVLQDLRNAVSYTSIIAIPILFGSMAIPVALLRTAFGAEYAGIGAVLVGLALFQVVQAFGNPMSSTLRGADRVEVEFRASVVGIIINAVFAVLLGLTFGVIGVVVSAILAELATIVIYQYTLREEFGEYVLPRPILGQMASGTVMFAAVSFVAQEVAIVGWLSLMLVVGFGAAVYFTTLTVISRHFRNTALELLPFDTEDLADWEM